jgi:hypothetical protein
MEQIIILIGTCKLKIVSVSLNSLWISLGLTQISFLSCLKLIFFTVFFLRLNIFLLYLKYKDSEYNKINPPSYLESNLLQELQKIGKQVIVGIGLLASVATLNDQFVSKKKNSRRVKNRIRYNYN